MSTVTDKIFKEIKERNLNISEFADKIGLSRNSIYRLSDETIKYETLKKIATVLKLPITHFINEGGEKEGQTAKEKAKQDTLLTLTEKHRKLLNELNSVAFEIEQEAKKRAKKGK